MRHFPGLIGLPERWLAAHFGLCLVLGAFAGAPLSAQSPVKRVPAQLACMTCEIALARGVTIGADDKAPITSWPEVFLRLDDGSYLVAGTQGEERIPRLFDRRGRYTRQLGRLGSGPGEFRGVQAAFTIADTLFLFDRGNARLVVVAPDFSVTRQAPSPPLVHAASATPRGYVLSANVPDASRIGYALHLFDVSGAYRSPMGAPEPVSLGAPVRPHVVAPAVGGGVWTAAMWGEYDLHRWSAHGELVQTLVVQSGWYRSARRPWPVTPSRAPVTQISRIWQDDAGILWVLGMAADPHWSRGLGAATLFEGREGYPIERMDQVYDAVLEAIDPIGGRVIARKRLDELPQFLVRPGEVGAFVESDDGEVALQTIRVSLRGRWRQ